MGLAETLLPEFGHEMANTRESLERVPEDKLDWKPHDKSMSRGIRRFPSPSSRHVFVLQDMSRRGRARALAHRGAPYVFPQ